MCHNMVASAKKSSLDETTSGSSDSTTPVQRKLRSRTVSDRANSAIPNHGLSTIKEEDLGGGENIDDNEAQEETTDGSEQEDDEDVQSHDDDENEYDEEFVDDNSVESEGGQSTYYPSSLGADSDSNEE